MTLVSVNAGWRVSCRAALEMQGQFACWGRNFSLFGLIWMTKCEKSSERNLREMSHGRMRAPRLLCRSTPEMSGKAKVPVKVTINGYTWRSTVGNRGGIQYIVVNAEARRGASV